MSASTAFSLSHLLSQLLGRNVTFAQTTSWLDGKIPQAYGLYLVFPDEQLVVVKADLQLLGSFAGALVGLPNSEVKAHLRIDPVEGLLRDAICEVLNILAGAITSKGRASFSRMVTTVAELGYAATAAVNQAEHKSCFNVTVHDYEGGQFTVLGPVPRQNVMAGEVDA